MKWSFPAVAALCGLVAILIALCMSKLATGMPLAGGGYLFVVRSFGPMMGALQGEPQQKQHGQEAHWAQMCHGKNLQVVSHRHQAIGAAAKCIPFFPEQDNPPIGRLHQTRADSTIQWPSKRCFEAFTPP